MSEQDRIEEGTQNNNTDRAGSPDGKGLRKKKRYQGYDVEKITNRGHKANRPWFWKVLGVSLILSLMIVTAACVYFIIGDRQKTDYLRQNWLNTRTERGPFIIRNRS